MEQEAASWCLITTAVSNLHGHVQQNRCSFCLPRGADGTCMHCSCSSHHPRVKERSPCLCPTMVPDGRSNSLGLVQGEEFSTMRFCRVWFLLGIGVASQVENDVRRLLEMSNGSQRVGPREGKKCLWRGRNGRL